MGAVGDYRPGIIAGDRLSLSSVAVATHLFFGVFADWDTPLENVAATPPIREARLYQASFLLRDYAFDLEELLFSADAPSPHEVDPKMAWANVHLQDEPVELNHAERRHLLRVPGIGPRSADRIMEARRAGKLRDLRICSNWVSKRSGWSDLCCSTDIGRIINCDFSNNADTGDSHFRPMCSYRLWVK